MYKFICSCVDESTFSAREIQEKKIQARISPFQTGLASPSWSVRTICFFIIIHILILDRILYTRVKQGTVVTQCYDMCFCSEKRKTVI